MTAQVVANYVHLELPSQLVAGLAHHSLRGQALAYHRYLTARGAYSDLYTLYWHHHLYTHPIPYIDVRIEYPVVIGLYMTAAAALTHGVRAYFLLSSIGLWVCTVGSVCCLWTVSRRAAWIFSLCPLLLVFSLLNWDMLAIFFMLLGWCAWRRERYGQASFWLALGTCTKLYPAFLLVFCAVALVRRWRRQEENGLSVIRYGLVAVLTAAATNVPFMVLATKRWAYFFVMNKDRNQYVSIVYALHILSRGSPRAVANDVFVAVVLGAVAVGCYLVWRGVGPVQVAAVAFCIFLLMQKVYSPQYTLWLIPLALLAEWELWTIAALSLVGLSDYSSAAVNNYLRMKSQAITNWYATHMEPFNKDVRLGVLALVAVYVVARALYERAERRRGELPRPHGLPSLSA